MAVDRNFRAALNGFNRSDVVNYIEESSISHEKALRQLRDENARLRADLEKLQAEQEAQAELTDPPMEANEPAQDVSECAVDEDAPAEAPEASISAPSERELAAYRRAEAAERSARQRATRLCRQVNDIVETASRQFSESGADVESLMSDLNICLRRLNDTFAELRLTFDETNSAFASIEPLEAEELVSV